MSGVDYIRRQIAAQKGETYDPEARVATVRFVKVQRHHTDQSLARALINPEAPEVRVTNLSGGQSARLDVEEIIKHRIDNIELMRAAAKLYAKGGEEWALLFEQFVDEALAS